MSGGFCCPAGEKKPPNPFGGFLSCLAAYFAASAMYWTAARNSSSLPVKPPFGGIAFRPLVAIGTT